MKVWKVLAALFCLGLLYTILPPTAKADEWNQKTYVTFNEPVEVPGMVLPAGTYVFKLMDSPSDRNIVQIFDKDEMHLYTTILAIPDYRLDPRGRTVITFEERAANSPEAIHAWFYPGENYGQEFVYPKARALELARATKQAVLAMPTELAANITKPAKSANEPHVMAMKKAKVVAVTPEQKEVTIATNMAPPAPASTSQKTAKSEKAPKHLPKTASDLPLLALLGLAALSAGAVLRILAKQVA